MKVVILTAQKVLNVNLTCIYKLKTLIKLEFLVINFSKILQFFQNVHYT